MWVKFADVPIMLTFSKNLHTYDNEIMEIEIYFF